MEHGPPNMTVAPTPDHRLNDSHNSTENSENERSWGSLDFDDWMRILSLLIAPLGLLGFRIPRTPFSVYILNLAAADGLFLCSTSLLNIDVLLGYIFYHFAQRILLLLRYFSYAVGLSLLAAISTERCLSALFPVWYRCHRRCHRPKHTSVPVSAGLWALVGVLGAIRVFCGWEFRLIIDAVYFLPLTCVLCVSSLTLLLRVQSSSRRRQPPRLYLLVLLSVLVFLLCGLPLGVWIVLNFHLHIDLMHYWLRHLLACVNSSVNPLIYFFVGRLGHKRREPLRAVLQRALGEEQESGGGTTNTPHTGSPETTL